MIDYEDTMPYFDRDDWVYILRALEWDEESAKYYDEAEYDYLENARLRAKIRGLIGFDND